MSSPPPFWEQKSLEDMSHDEWEVLCDGCGKCCLVLLQDEEDDAVYETDVCCHLFDPVRRRCTQYDQRHDLVPTCVNVTPDNIETLSWMPDTCAYRLLQEGKGLPDWHPLLTGRPESVADAGVAVSSDVISERKIDVDHLYQRVTGRRFP
ncbi:MAG: YcgN family cysteine cluster protein [Pseudomonadota bacterium]